MSFKFVSKYRRALTNSLHVTGESKRQIKKKTPQLQHNVSQKHPQKGINLHDTNKGLRLRYGSLSAFVVMLDFLVARFLVLLLLLSSEIVGNLILRTGLIFSGFFHSLFSSYIFLLSFLSSSR